MSTNNQKESSGTVIKTFLFGLITVENRQKKPELKCYGVFGGTQVRIIGSEQRAFLNLPWRKVPLLALGDESRSSLIVPEVVNRRG